MEMKNLTNKEQKHALVAMVSLVGGMIGAALIAVDTTKKIMKEKNEQANTKAYLDGFVFGSEIGKHIKDDIK